MCSLKDGETEDLTKEESSLTGQSRNVICNVLSDEMVVRIGIKSGSSERPYLPKKRKKEAQ